MSPPHNSCGCSSGTKPRPLAVGWFELWFEKLFVVTGETALCGLCWLVTGEPDISDMAWLRWPGFVPDATG